MNFRSDPYRLLFPLGWLLAWAGVLHWLLLATGVIGEYRAIFHSIAQIQGFLTCFAVGFLFTFIPRRTGTPGPSWPELAFAMIAPVATTVCAWFDEFALAQAFWAPLVAMVAVFALRRVWGRAERHKLPPTFIWVPSGLLLSMGGAVLVALTNDESWLHDVGRGLVLQGLFSGLMIGIGGALLPMLLSGPLLKRHPRPPIWLEVLLVLVFGGSFFVEQLAGVREGFAVRFAAVTLALASAELWRPPRLPGSWRKLLYGATWCLPLGSLVVAALPEYRRAGLHVTFIGCFGLAVLIISRHVLFAHAKPQLGVPPPSKPTTVMGALLGMALCARILVDADPSRVMVWLGIAAAFFLAATVVWASQILRIQTRV